MRVCAIHNGTGSRFYRLIPQLKFLQSQGHEITLIASNDKRLMENMAWCDILILQMVFSLPLIQKAKSLGKRVIFECDDLIHTVPKTHYSYEETRGLKRYKWWYLLWRVLRLCDGFIATTPGLIKLYGRFAASSLHFPNYLDLSHWLKETKENKSDFVRILWAGSKSHTGDLLFIEPVIAEILKRYPQVRFLYNGHGGIPSDDLYARFVYGEDIFKNLPLNARESQLPGSNVIWPYILASQLADIAIAPLEKNYFNSFKSQCKYLEYAINGYPGVYSRSHYTDVKDGETGLLAETEEEWIEALSRLVENDKLRKRMGAKAREAALRDFDIRSHLPEWADYVLDK